MKKLQFLLLMTVMLGFISLKAQVDHEKITKTVQCSNKDKAPTNFCYFEDMGLLFIVFEDKNSAEIISYFVDSWEELGTWKVNKTKTGTPCIGTGARYLFYPTIYDPKVRSVTLPIKIKTPNKSGNLRVSNNKYSNYTRIDLKKSGKTKVVNDKDLDCENRLKLIEIKGKEAKLFADDKYSLVRDFHGTVFISIVDKK